MAIFNKIKWKYLRYRVYLDRHQINAYILPAVICFVLTVVLVVLNAFFQDHDLWKGMLVAGGNAMEFCELNRFGDAIVQPSNTWSNFGFLLTGMLCLTIGINDWKLRSANIPNLLVRYPIFSILMGLSCIYLFLGSFLYHASLTSIFQWMDQTGMYTVALVFIAYNIFRFFPTRFHKRKNIHRSSHHLIITLLIAVNILFLTVLYKINVNVLFPVLVMLLLGTHLIYTHMRVDKQPMYKFLYGMSLALLTISFVFWILDRQNILCAPESIFQGHALWHLLNAASILLLYFCYRTEVMVLEEIYAEKEEVLLGFK